MHMLRIPPEGRASAHLHAGHETVTYVFEGAGILYWGDSLEHLTETNAGDLICIPAAAPLLPMKRGTLDALTVIALTGPHGQEAVALLPEFEAFVPD